MSLRLTEAEIERLDGEVDELNAEIKPGTNLGRPKYAFGRADVLRKLWRAQDGDDT